MFSGCLSPGLLLQHVVALPSRRRPLLPGRHRPASLHARRRRLRDAPSRAAGAQRRTAGWAARRDAGRDEGRTAGWAARRDAGRDAGWAAGRDARRAAGGARWVSTRQAAGRVGGGR